MQRPQRETEKLTDRTVTTPPTAAATPTAGVATGCCGYRGSDCLSMRTCMYVRGG